MKKDCAIVIGLIIIFLFASFGVMHAVAILFHPLPVYEKISNDRLNNSPPVEKTYAYTLDVHGMQVKAPYAPDTNLIMIMDTTSSQIDKAQKRSHRKSNRVVAFLFVCFVVIPYFVGVYLYLELKHGISSKIARKIQPEDWPD